MRHLGNSNWKVTERLETAVQAYSAVMFAINRGRRYSHLLVHFIRTLEALPLFDEGLWLRLHAFVNRNRQHLNAHELRYDLRLLFVEMAADVRRHWMAG